MNNILLRQEPIVNLICKLISKPQDFFEHCRKPSLPQYRVAQIIAELDLKYGKEPILKTRAAQAKFEEVLFNVDLHIKKLSERQLYMLYLLNAGLQAKEIATEMDVSKDRVDELKEEVRKKWNNVPTPCIIAVFEREVTALVMAAYLVQENSSKAAKEIAKLLQLSLSYREVKIKSNLKIAGVLMSVCCFLCFTFYLSRPVYLHTNTANLLEENITASLAPQNITRQLSIAFIEMNTKQLSFQSLPPNQLPNAFLEANFDLPTLTPLDESNPTHQHGCLAKTLQESGCLVF